MVFQGASRQTSNRVLGGKTQERPEDAEALIRAWATEGAGACAQQTSLTR